MRKTSFNPYIALSEVTLSVIIALILILTMVSIHIKPIADANQKLESENREFKEKEGKHERLLSVIRVNQDELIKALARTDLQQISMASGVTSLLVRVDLGRYCNDDKLNPRGEGVFQKMAETLEPSIRKQARLVFKRGEQDEGILVELNIQGHCGYEPNVDLWKWSHSRATRVREIFSKVLSEETGPTPILSVSAFAAHRLAHYSPDESIRKNFANRYNDDMDAKQLVKEASQNAIAQMKSRLESSGDPELMKSIPIPDRIDLLFIYSGLLEEDNYVSARDPASTEMPVPLYGPRNSTSVDTIDDRRPEP